MKYVDNLKQATDHLRLALPMMIRYAIPPHPHNYAIWYHYVAGMDPELKQAIDAMMQQGIRLTPVEAERLYATYISPESDIERKQQENFYKLVGQVAHNLDTTHAETLQLGSALTNAANKFNEADIDTADMHQLKWIIDDLNQNIKAFSHSTEQFQSQLDAAQTEIDELKQALEQSRWAASHDSLTGLYNRDAFQRQIECLHHNHSSAHLILIDIDHFKHINDSFGHNAGDNVLKAVGKVLNTDDYGFAARYGGDEFAILIDKRTSQEALQVANNLRLSIAQKELRYNGSAAHITSVTASFGITCLNSAFSVGECIEQADKALYEAKKSGRNCVALSDAAVFSA